jgi:hypothetical protein
MSGGEGAATPCEGGGCSHCVGGEAGMEPDILMGGGQIFFFKFFFKLGIKVYKAKF